jgi:hypothetical protein
MQEHLPEPENPGRRFDRVVTGVVLAVCLAACILAVGRMGSGAAAPADEGASLNELAARAEQAWQGLPDQDANQDVRDLCTKLHAARMFRKEGQTADARDLYQGVLTGCERLQHANDPPPES